MNSASTIVAEYSQRKRLADLGYTTPIGELSAWKAEAFTIIDCEINKLQEMESKKRGNKRK